MSTVVLQLSANAIRQAADALRAGQLVAFPTETVYGLGARADQSGPVRSIFAAKGRPPGNPLIVHVPDREAALSLAADWPPMADALARAFWPGPLTLVVTRAPGKVADEATASGPTVGVRVPAHPAALDLLREAGVPVAAPSANRSTTISPTTAAHVMKTLGGIVNVVLDAGPTGFGIESTIIDVTRSPARLLRHGAIALAEIARFGEVIDATQVSVDPSARAEAPGMHEKHYAPRARALLVPAEHLRAKVNELQAQGEKVGVIDRATERPSSESNGPPSWITLPADAEGYASNLYAALHALDDSGCDVIVIAEVPSAPAWAAIRDRLRRATAR
ncbi:MAG: L-threonylcarbamoyladenylate synthase [Polyangiaceae bacterium]